MKPPVRVCRTPLRYKQNLDISTTRIDKKTTLQKKVKKLASDLYSVLDVLDVRINQDSKEELLVIWAKPHKGESAHQWILSEHNPELKQFLNANNANPFSTTLAKTQYYESAKKQPVNKDVLALRQSIFDSLSYRYTGEGQKPSCRINISIPFDQDSFVSTFGNHCSGLGQGSAIVGGLNNVTFKITGQELTKCIGAGWSSRTFSRSSTVTYVNFKDYINVSWGFKTRLNYDHKTCPRCTYIGDNNSRPPVCSPVNEPLVGPPWITLCFTKGRRNRVANLLAAQKSLLQ